jgi:D-alanine transaminase
LDRSILPGCTRAALRDLLAPAGFSLREEAFSVAELRAAREIFLTSASSHVKPVLRLDGVAVGDGAVGAVTRGLFGVFAEAVRKQAVLF